MKKIIQYLLAAILLIAAFSLLSTTPLASAITQYSSASVQGEKLKKATEHFNSLIAAGDLNLINANYDSFTLQLKQTEALIGQVPGRLNRSNLSAQYVRPAKIAKERTIYEVSQYRLMNMIDNRFMQASLENAGPDLAKLSRLEERSRAIKAAGNYQLLSVKTTQTLIEKRIQLENDYSKLKKTFNANEPAFLFPKLTELKTNWAVLSEGEKKEFIRKDPWTLAGNTKYLGYLPKHLGFLYHLTGEQDYKKMVQDMLPLYERYYFKKGRFQSPEYQNTGWWYRDQFARDGRGLLEAYQYTQLPEVLRFVDSQAEKWIQQVPRGRNLGFTVFPYGISDKGETGPLEINPNQNLQVASLFSELYWEPKSRFYQSPLAKDIVMNEVGAVLALQKKNGSLPLTQNLPLVEDTNYGGYSGNMLYQLAQVWGNEKWMKADVEIGKWLYNEYTMEHPWNTPADAPNYAIDRIGSFNLISRVQPFYAAGIPDEKVQAWIQFSETRFPNEKLYLMERWYISQSVPRDYLDKNITRKNQLPPKLYTEAADRTVSARMIAEEITDVKITVVDTDDSSVPFSYSEIEDLKKEIPLKSGKYKVNFDVHEANGSITQASKELVLTADHSVQLEVKLFDRNHRFYEKLEH
ncbi:hypothetical protein [Metabacillus sp. FJAT-52054]|uniref:SbsC C-terminal domain-containing protein n=1 Tax=Metabacillus sediminis TaxID=3117746 RepID=A0ABZ2NL42_9BACI